MLILSTVNSVSVPTLVTPVANVTVAPSSVLLKTSVPSNFKFATGFSGVLIKFKSWLLVQDFVALLHVKSLDPCELLSIIPPSSIAASLPSVLSSSNPNSIFLSSTLKVEAFINVLSPLTSKLPCTVTSPFTSSVAVGCALKIPTLDTSASMYTAFKKLLPVLTLNAKSALLCCVSKVVVLPAIFKIPNSVSPTPTLKPALFLILKLPVVTPFASVGKKLAADFVAPVSSSKPLADVATPLHQNPEVLVS